MFERIFVIKLLFIKGLISNVIHTELETTLEAAVYSLPQAKKWVEQFRTRDFACQKGTVGIDSFS
jgi:hypothetical protein